MVAAGDILLPREECRVPARINRFDARAAAASALCGYLGKARFVKWGDEDQDVEFALAAFYDEWPDSKVTFTTPTATIIEAGPIPNNGHSLTPTAIESSFGVFGENTLLWKTGESNFVLQVDFWLQNKPDREAIAAALPGLFAPGEDRSNVVLASHPQYWCAPVRCALTSWSREDTPDSVYESERRLMALVQCDVDIVELRCATVLTINAQAIVGEDVDVTLPEPESREITPGCCPED